MREKLLMLDFKGTATLIAASLDAAQAAIPLSMAILSLC
jgi:hypothetical protein